MRLNTSLFVGIIIIAAVLRFWDLGVVPVSPDWDEVALGYNAYSILQTGRDEYGEFLPIVLRSFDDYKPALYAYCIIPFIKLFGLSTFSIRLPSAITGVLMIIGIYYLIGEFFLFHKSKNENVYTRWVPLITSALLAISPWHLQFSRVAFESSVGTAFNIFGTLFFLKGLRKGWYFPLSAFFYGLSLYTYQSEKAFVPLLLIALLCLLYKHIFSLDKKYVIVSIFLGLIISLPIISFTLFNKQSLSRAVGVSIFSDKNSLLQRNVQDIIRDKEANNKLGLFLDNRRFIYAKTVVLSYINHFDINWLFIRGDYNLPRHHAPDIGLLYIIEFPFILIGIYQLIFNNNFFGIDKKIKYLIFSWYLLAPIPASVTIDAPHSVRTLNLVAIYPIFTAFGIITAYLFCKNLPSKKILKVTGAVCILVIFTLNFSYYINQYFVQQNYYHAKYWQYGYKELVDYVDTIKGNYNKIIVSNTETMDQSHMFFLFYLQYDPKKYLSEGGTYSRGFAENKNKFSNFEFRKFDIYKETEANTLFIGAPSDFPEALHRLHTIYYPDKEPAIYIAQH
ncbi:MAG: hypothetical protein A3J14_01960 [Candidatus Levybacteria bacterium RIFCSPLOWO2_02_FULL_37_18]|nr:MAG: hypothetical protein A3J14_01960 [Candidatus Levybacteria bacterium RIFCSPLOWO2_02_FULL_37_18]